MRDWNHDGKIDGRDRMHDYMVFSELSNDSGTRNRSGYGGYLSGIGIGLLLFGVLIIFIEILG